MKSFKEMKKIISYKEHELKKELYENNFGIELRFEYFKLLGYVRAFVYYYDSNCDFHLGIQIKDLDYIEKCFIEDSAVEILSKIKSFFNEDYEFFNKIETTFKAIKLNNKLEEKITTSLKTKKVKI